MVDRERMVAMNCLMARFALKLLILSFLKENEKNKKACEKNEGKCEKRKNDVEQAS